jgi:hypothetical protein
MPIDYERYPPDWKTMIVPAILKRASNCCEDCGLPNRTTVYSITMAVRHEGRYKQRAIWFRSIEDATRESLNGKVKPVKVVLTVAHLDHDELNHEITLSRLKALCQCCHLRYDAKEKYRRIMNKTLLK